MYELTSREFESRVHTHLCNPFDLRLGQSETQGRRSHEECVFAQQSIPEWKRIVRLHETLRSQLTTQR